MALIARRRRIIQQLLDETEPSVGSCYSRLQVAGLMMDAMELEAGEVTHEWLTVADAAVVAGVSVRTIWNWIQRGMVETTRTNGGKPRVRRASLWSSEGEK